MKILMCTDGSSSSILTAELICLLEFPADTHITVLGVSENIDHLENLSSSMDLIKEKVGPAFVLDRKIRNGNPIEEIMAEAVESSYDLIAVGGGGTQLGLLSPRLGSTTSKLTRKLHTHFLVARNIPKEITKVLICAGSGAPSSRTVKLGGDWISHTNAQIGLLHVLPKESQDLDKEAAGNPLLVKAVQQLRTLGVKNNIIPLIRKGLVVEEVLAELSDGRYDVLVVGAHYQPGQDRWQGTLLDDITDQLLNKSTCSVLII